MSRRTDEPDAARARGQVRAFLASLFALDKPPPVTLVKRLVKARTAELRQRGR